MYNCKIVVTDSDIKYLIQKDKSLKKGIEDGEFIESSGAVSAALFAVLPEVGSGDAKVMVYKK